jgi:hypothetical protein
MVGSSQNRFQPLTNAKLMNQESQDLGTMPKKSPEIPYDKML